LEFGAQAVDVEAEFARAEALARLVFFVVALCGERDDLRGFSSRDDDHAIGVGDDDVAGMNDRAGADDRNVHRSGSGFYCPLRGNGSGPDRKFHRSELG
jgi:hypothetical protein